MAARAEQEAQNHQHQEDNTMLNEDIGNAKVVAVINEKGVEDATTTSEKKTKGQLFAEFLKESYNKESIDNSTVDICKEESGNDTCDNFPEEKSNFIIKNKDTIAVNNTPINEYLEANEKTLEHLLETNDSDTRMISLPNSQTYSTEQYDTNNYEIKDPDVPTFEILDDLEDKDNESSETDNFSLSSLEEHISKSLQDRNNGSGGEKEAVKIDCFDTKSTTLDCMNKNEQNLIDTGIEDVEDIDSDDDPASEYDMIHLEMVGAASEIIHQQTIDTTEIIEPAKKYNNELEEITKESSEYMLNVETMNEIETKEYTRKADAKDIDCEPENGKVPFEISYNCDQYAEMLEELSFNKEEEVLAGVMQEDQENGLVSSLHTEIYKQNTDNAIKINSSSNRSDFEGTSDINSDSDSSNKESLEEWSIHSPCFNEAIDETERCIDNETVEEIERNEPLQFTNKRVKAFLGDIQNCTSQGLPNISADEAWELFKSSQYTPSIKDLESICPGRYNALQDIKNKDSHEPNGKIFKNFFWTL